MVTTDEQKTARLSQGLAFSAFLNTQKNRILQILAPSILHHVIDSTLSSISLLRISRWILP